MRFLLALVLAVGAYGQCTITGLKIADNEDSADDITSNCIRLSYTLSGCGTVTTAIDAGATTSLGETKDDVQCSDSGTCYSFICVGSPSTKHYYKITADTTEALCPVTCSNCGSGDDALFADSSGLTCDNTSEPPNVTHPAHTSPRTPAAPTHSDSDPYDDCASPTATTDTTPANLITDFEAVNDDGGVQLLRVDISGGNTLSLSTNWTMQALSGGTTRVCIEPYFADADTRPIDNVQTHWGHRDKQLIIRRNDPKRGERVSTGVAFITGTSNVTFLDTVFEDNPTPQAPIRYTVTAVTPGTPGSSSTQLTISEACNSATAQGAEIALNLPGMTYTRNAYVDSCSSNTIHVNRFQAWTTTFSGTLSGNGTAVQGVVPITTCNTSSPIQCDTDGAHGLPNDGTPGNAGESVVFVGNVNGQTGANGTWNYSVIDSDTVELTGSTSVGAFTSSPRAFLRHNTAPRYQLFDASNTTGMHFGRTVFGNPWDGSYGVRMLLSGGDSTGLVVRDSILMSANGAFNVDPSDGTMNGALHDTQYGSYISISGATDIFIANNLFLNCAGICIDAQVDSPVVENFTFDGNHMVATDRPFADVSNGYFPGSLGPSGRMRHGIELKATARNVAITNNLFDGQAIDADNAPYWIWISDTTTGTGTATVFRSADIDISGNYFRNGATALGFGSQTLSTPVGKNNRSFINKLRFSGNFISYDSTRRRITPGGPASSGTPTDDDGEVLVPRTPTQDLIIDDNAWFSTGGADAEQLIAINTRSRACQMNGNIFVLHGGASQGFTAFGSTETPFTSTNNLTRFDSFCPGGTATGNLFVPGVEAPATVPTTKSSTDTADTVTQAECETAIPGSGTFADRVCVAGASYAARHSTVWGSDQIQEASYTSYGPDMAAMRANVFKEIRNIDVEQTGPTAITVSFLAWTTAACPVRMSDDDWATAVSQTDAGGSTSQSVSFSGLTPLATYRMWIECPNGKPARWEQTLQ